MAGLDQHNSRRARRGGRGFTLIEVLLVTLVLAILAALVVPQFTGLVENVKDRIADVNRSRLQSQVTAYYQDHGRYPSLASFPLLLTKKTDKEGNLDPDPEAGKVYGPYLDQIPNHPMSGTNTVGDGPPGSSDWFYDSTTGQVRSNYASSSQVGESMSNMKGLLGAIHAYASQNDSAMPGSLAELADTYIPAAKYESMTTNPVTGEKPGYVYVPPDGPLNQMSNPDKTPILYEIVGGKINYSGLIGYADGSVKTEESSS
ncbi:MAG: prepilin-type N-terminal cleavage/methylation domain-containing protein [Phycisphaeraceae bacterium]|nr:prepilin-type N-terminal cleavage/methylation domain-containing protein [Phycisphaeraceae bacterium]